MADPKRRSALAAFWHAEGHTAWVRDALVAGVLVLIVIGSIFTYSSTWPPMVVIESGSMMHANDRSMLGVIDTGDLTLVKKVDGRGDIVTYFQGKQTGHQTYGNFGDVIIYAKNGHREITPIIHRAMVWLEYVAGGVPVHAYPPCAPQPTCSQPPAATNSTWVIPELAMNITVGDDENRPAVVLVGEVRSWHTGAEGALPLILDMTALVKAMGGHPHSGFITKGDHNGAQDEGTPRGDARLPPNVGGLTGPAPPWQQADPHSPEVPVQPVLEEWVVGRAEGELPWFGVIKLWAGGTRGPIPGNSQFNLLLAIFVIGAGPYIFEKAWGAYGHHLTDRVPQRTKDRWHGFWDRWPGGKGRAQRRQERFDEREGRRRKAGGRRHGGRGR